MAPTTTTPGANPAPLYKEKTNAIAALMARHTSSPSLTFLSSLPSRNNNNTSASSGGGPHKKTPAQLAAAAEDYEFDRLAQYDDNMGVGMFAPENRKEKEEKRRKELEDRRLKARLGLGSKRKGTEWEGVSGVSQAAAAAVSDEDDEMGRSGVGRAKKRKRVVANVDAGLSGKSRGESKDIPMVQVAGAQVVEVTNNAPESNDGIETLETNEHAHDPSLQVGTIAADSVDTEAKAKRRRKKKKKNKSKAPNGAVEAAMMEPATG